MHFKQNRIFRSKCVQHNWKDNELKMLQRMYHANINVNLKVENVIQNKIGIMLNVHASEKNLK